MNIKFKRIIALILAWHIASMQCATHFTPWPTTSQSKQYDYQSWAQSCIQPSRIQAFKLGTLWRTSSQRLSKNEHTDYTLWSQACRKLPAFIHMGPSYDHTALDWQTFNATLHEFMQINSEWYSNQSALWLSNAPHTDDEFYDVNAQIYKPFVQKLIVNPHSTIALRGDLHGDIHSLLAYINFLQKEGYMNGFSITKKDFYLVFLGDYVDRGNYGAEVLYTLMRLKIENPDHIMLVRGNHEDLSVCSRYGFYQECAAKSADASSESFLRITRLYDFLPVALYLGCGTSSHIDYLQCCHGGMEVGYNPKALLQTKTPLAFDWITSLAKKSEFNALTCGDANTRQLLTRSCNLQDITPAIFLAQKNYGDIGFMWSDFHITDDGTILAPSPRGAGLIYGKQATHALLQRASSSSHTLQGVLRAHQHTASMDDMMANILDPENLTNHKGVGKLWKDASCIYKDIWNGIVCTFLVAPDSNYSCEGSLFDFDAFALLKTASTFDAWRMKVHRNMLADIIPIFNYFSDLHSYC